jgi:hypothetical protein
MEGRAGPPRRLPLAGDAWVRFRRVPGPGGKVLVTSGRGRFLLLPAADFEALARGAADPENAPRKKLAGLGFVHTRAAAAPRAAGAPEGAPIRVASVDGYGATGEACDRLIDEGALFTVRFDGAPEAHDANRAVTGAPPHDVAVRAVRDLHARCAARGLDPALAYVNAVVTVTRATIAAGPDALVAACEQAGLVYVELSPLSPSGVSREAYEALACSLDDHLRFQRAAVERIVEVNLGGTLLVEKRLALHLEALVAGSAPAGGEGCADCAYDPFCGSSLLRRYLTNEDGEPKAWGTPYCERSMGTFDGVFELLAGPQGPALRRVHQQWMAARDRVAKRLAGPRG